MNDFLENLLQQVYELEGLVALAIKRGEEVPQTVLSMISAKAAAIADAAATVLPNEAPADDNTDATIGIDTLPDDTPDDDITVELIDDDDADDKQTQEEEESPSASEEETAPIPTAEYASNFCEAATEECAAQTQEEETITSKNEEITPEPHTEAEVQIVEPHPKATAQNKESAEEDSEITLDEALQRDMTKDLRHAFSLNDRYRYRRELFGNSDSVMNETLNLVETMHTFDEAEDYFYNDLQWDHESPEVADFMVIIKNHFWNKRQQV